MIAIHRWLSAGGGPTAPLGGVKVGFFFVRGQN
jgi:hypothetical protein